MSNRLHTPVPPSWRCIGCGEDWPCEPARKALLAEARTDPTAVGVYLQHHLYSAALDLPKVSRGDLYQRFVAWTKPAPLDEGTRP